MSDSVASNKTGKASMQQASMKEERKGQEAGLPKFDGEDSASWKVQIQAYLEWKGKMDVVTRGKPRRYASNAQGITEADRQLRERDILGYESNDKHVKSILFLSLSAKQVRSVIQCKTAKKIWDKLSSLHGKKSIANRLQLQREFSNLKLRKGEKLQEYISRAESLQGLLIDVGAKHIDEITLCYQIVCGLSDEYRSFMSTWANLDESKQSIAELVAHLGAEEQIVERYDNEEGESSAYAAECKEKEKNKKRSKRCYGCGEEGM